MMLYVLVFIVGLLIGSFLNVCIYRIPQGQSIVFPPSHCTNCNTRLRPRDLIPLLSYLFYRGKCPYCKSSISLQYPIIELSTGLVYLLLFIKFYFSVEFIFFSILCTLLLIISGIDYHHYIIHNEMVIFILTLGLIYKLITQFYLKLPVDWIGSITGVLAGGGFFLLVATVSKGGMGGGDIKLMAALGFWVGWKLTILTIFLSFVIGAILSALLLLLKIKGRKDMIPFGPFIAIAIMITIFSGQQILNWYLTAILS